MTENKKLNNKIELSCKLSTPELRRRKEAVIAHLKKQILYTRELKNGFAYKFPGADTIIDELITFIKTERLCCKFFTFNISIAGHKSETWLKITGPQGAKDFIKTELEL
jgi:hypothetical protein